MPIAQDVKGFLEISSWIRKMFEEGNNLKKVYGEENVFDFSLGNPILEPPKAFKETLKSIVSNGSPGIHMYMPNAGIEEARRAVARKVSKDEGIDVPPDSIVMTVGAAGGLNVILKAILNKGEEVITPIPYFVEYKFYVHNFGGNLIPAETREDFSIDVGVIEGLLNEKTKAVLINNPNNPSGVVYKRRDLEDLISLLDRKSKEFGGPIYLISDEPYRKIVYNGAEVAPLLSMYRYAIVVSSFSKDLSIPGERIGYIAVSPLMEKDKRELLLDALIFANRVLGFVNAPALMQRVVALCAEETTDFSLYKRNRELFIKILSDLNFQFVRPDGAFYIFPKSPIPDDVEFVKEAQKERILIVPGSGFGKKGHFRIAYCVPTETIERSIPSWERLAKRFGMI